MTGIYDQHDKAFKDVSAYVILNSEGRRVATIAFKYPRDGAGRLYAYVHWIGIEMVRGWAAGGGYDKHSAACAAAARRIAVGQLSGDEWTNSRHQAAALVEALEKDDGVYWDKRLTDAGFRVLQAI